MIKAPGGIGALPPLFDNLSEFDKSLLKQTGRVLQGKKGAVVMRRNQASMCAYIFQSGWCAISLGGHLTGLLGPGATFLATVTAGAPSWAEVVALSTATILSFDVQTLLTVCGRNASLPLSFLEMALKGVSQAHLMYALKGEQPLELRLADLFWHVGTLQEDGSRLLPGALPQTVMASLLGASRCEVNRKRQFLIKAGYLFEKNQAWFLDASTPLLLANMPLTLTNLAKRKTL